MSTAHTARYQYIPALALPTKDELNLRLNNPPSFRNPKSVIAIALPPVQPVIAPPLRVAEANEVYRADKPQLVLPVEGAPLVFATSLAHNIVLKIETGSGAGFDLPVVPDPERGGFLIATEEVLTAGGAARSGA